MHDGSDYDRLRARHTFQLDSYTGGDAYRTPTRTTLTTARAWTYSAVAPDGGASSRLARTAREYVTYLVPHPAESDEAFESRLARACYINCVAPIVDAYAEAVTARIERELPAGYGPMDDVDARGSTWAEHVEEVARLTGLHGYLAVVYDAPAAAPAVSRADELARGLVPCCILVPPTAWAWVEVDARGRVVTFAHVEDAYQDRTGGAALYADVTVRVWTLRGGSDGKTAEWQVRKGRVNHALGGLGAQRSAFQIAAGDDGAEQRGPLPAALGGKLPVVFAYCRRVSSSRFPLGQSLADDACDIGRSIYNKLSEEDEIHSKAGFPFLAIPLKSTGGAMDAQTEVAIGPGRGLGYDSTAGAPSYVQPSSESSRELRDSCVFRFMLAMRLAGLGSTADTSAAPQSGEALRIRSREFESKASRFAAQMARYERAGLALWAALAGSAEVATVAYAKRFTLPDPSEDIVNSLKLLTDCPIEVGVEAKTTLVMRALNAVLSLSDEDAAEMMAGIRARLEASAGDVDDERATEGAERVARRATAQTTATPRQEAPATVTEVVTAPEEAKDPGAALNGAQVTSLREIVLDVANGALPRATGIGLILAAFPLTPEQAEDIMGEVGDGFVAAAPKPSPFGGPPFAKAAPPPAADGTAAAEDA
jgi:hypothetical protein